MTKLTIDRQVFRGGRPIGAGQNIIVSMAKNMCPNSWIYLLKLEMYLLKYEKYDGMTGVPWRTTAWCWAERDPS